MTFRISALAAVLVLAGTASAFGQSPAPAPQIFSFALIGDLGYNARQEPQMEAVLAEINRTPLAFVVHVGDLGHQSQGSCTETLWEKRLGQFRASAHPLIFTPGDNDWTDCHEKQGVTGGDPLERLAKLRGMFFQGSESLGQRTFRLTRQSDGSDPTFAKYRENVRWDFGGVTFVTLHVVGSNNGKGQTPAGDEEYAERNAAALAWMRAGFEHAQANNSRAIMVIQQANIYPEFPPMPGPKDSPTDGFTDVRAALAKEAVAFGKPVVLAHGDSHYFRVDKPYMRLRSRPEEPAIENFTRMEGFGSPNNHWVLVTVEAGEPEVFVARARIVPQNMLRGR